MDWTETGLRDARFQGFVPLLAVDLKTIPDLPGVYCLLRTSAEAPVFLESSPAGWWKDKDPSVSTDVLQKAWIEGPTVIYIGKASTSLRRRLRPYQRIGEGHKAAHWGGRYIWQLADYPDLLIAWRVESGDANAIESELIAEFRTGYGDRPFANLVK